MIFKRCVEVYTPCAMFTVVWFSIRTPNHVSILKASFTQAAEISEFVDATAGMILLRTPSVFRLSKDGRLNSAALARALLCSQSVSSRFTIGKCFRPRHSHRVNDTVLGLPWTIAQSAQRNPRKFIRIRVHGCGAVEARRDTEDNVPVMTAESFCASVYQKLSGGGQHKGRTELTDFYKKEIIRCLQDHKKKRTQLLSDSASLRVSQQFSRE
eukprot:Selendium_serpulae@DN4881_c0_g1_i4.p1